MRTLILKFSASAFALIALSLPVQVALLYEHQPSEVIAIFSKLTVLNWLVMASLLTASVMLLRASKWTPLMLGSSMLLVAFNNFFVGYHGADFSQTTAWLATLGFIGLNLPLVRPGRNWWKVADRKNVRLPVALFNNNDLLLPAESFDLSLSGIFVCLPDLSLIEASVADKGSVQVLLAIDDDHPPLRCVGKLVRSSYAKGRYPTGVGIQFQDMGQSERDRLKEFLHSK